MFHNGNHWTDALYRIRIAAPESLQAIKNFVEEDVETARYYPEDQNYLLEFEEKVAHDEVILST